MAKLYNQKLGLPLDYIEERIAFSQFTDGGAAVGTYQMKDAIPIGAHTLGTVVTGVVGFTGDTSAILTVGDGTDVDRYNTGTPSVFATVAALSMGVPSGTQGHVTAIRPTLTITSEGDFTAVVAGSLNIRIAFLRGV